MKRRALIISADKSKYGNLPGAKADAIAWRSFFKSPIGGEWKDEEISHLENPKKSSVEEMLYEIGKCDIGLVAFSGHGFHKLSHTTNESYVCLNNREDMKISDLNAGAGRMLIIADSCRGIHLEATLTINRSAMAKSANFQGRSRALYDEAFKSAEKGAIYMYSCDIEEAAGESDDGGYFSQSLITRASAWADDNEQRNVLRTDSAFNAAYKVVKKLAPQQNPQYDSGRRTTHFPFAIGLK